MEEKMHRGVNNQSISMINSIAQSFGLDGDLISDLMRVGEDTYNRNRANNKIENILKKYLEK